MILTYLMFGYDSRPNFKMPIMSFSNRENAIKKYKEFFGEEQDPDSIVVVNVDAMGEPEDGNDESVAFERYDKLTDQLFSMFNNLGSYETLEFWLEDKEEGEAIASFDF